MNALLVVGLVAGPRYSLLASMTCRRYSSAGISNDAIERLSTQDAHSLAVDPDTLTYRTIAELTTNEKAVRDAGSIAVAEL